MTAAGVPRARQARIRVPGLAIAALLLLVIGVLTVAPTASTYLAQRQKVEDAKVQIAQQKADLADLAEQRARWDDPAYVRAQAGSRLFYVLPGTTAYRVINGTTATGTAATPSSTAQADDTPWTDALLGSLVSAGTTDAPADPSTGG